MNRSQSFDANPAPTLIEVDFTSDLTPDHIGVKQPEVNNENRVLDGSEHILTLGRLCGRLTNHSIGMSVQRTTTSEYICESHTAVLCIYTSAEVC